MNAEDRVFYERQLSNAKVRLRAAQQDVEQATRRLNLSAGPKVANDTGTGLRLREYLLLRCDQNALAGSTKVRVEIADLRKALATDAKGSSDASIVPSSPVDGATGGGYPKGATIAVDACGPVDATTPGGDLLEQAAVINAGKFLLDRLVDHEVRMESDTDAREWFGHVTPAMSRFRNAIRALSARNQTDEGGEK